MIENAGLPLDGIGAAARDRSLSLDFVETSSYDRFAALGEQTFAEVSERTGLVCRAGNDLKRARS